MLAKFTLLTLLGAVLVSGLPDSPGGNKDFNEELVLRNDISQVIYTFVANLDVAASKVSGVAKVKIGKVKELFLELKYQISIRLGELRRQLKGRIHEAKKYGKAKYEEIKKKAKVIFEQKQLEIKTKVHELEQEVMVHLNSISQEDPIHH